MEKIRGWLIRLRDQSSVSYSRFGRPGEEQSDRPLPTTIIVAPFNENGSEFLFFNYWHVEKTAAVFSCLGMSMVVLFFLSTFLEFDWYHHERGVDFSALLGLFTYLAFGILIHYYVLHGIKKQKTYYLLPFIVVYSIACIGELIVCLALMFKIMDNSTQLYSSSNFQIHPPFLSIFILISISVVIQTIMLSAVLRCRQYLSLKLNHDLELKVAEKSRAKNPTIEIVIADNNNVITTTLSNTNSGANGGNANGSSNLNFFTTNYVV